VVTRRVAHERLIPADPSLLGGGWEKEFGQDFRRKANYEHLQAGAAPEQRAERRATPIKRRKT